MTSLSTALDDLLESIGVKVSRVTSTEIEAHCPFHADRHPSFYMNAETGLWLCFQCSARGSLESLVEALNGAPIDIKSYLLEAKYANLTATKPPIEETTPPVDLRMVRAKYESFKEPPEWAIEARFIDRDASREYGLRWDRGWVIPIHDPLERVLWGWQFKRLDLVLNYPKSITKSKALFGYHQLGSKEVVLVESPLDVVRLASAGVDAVATFGAFVSNEQIHLLVRYANSITLALDADKAGQDQMARIYPLIAKRVNTRIAEMPDGCKDPGDLTNEQVERIFK